jgi:hypothetical protein
VSKRRQTFAAAVALATLIARPSAQAPSLDEVLKRTAAYVAEFRKQLSGIVAEEIYVQEIVETGPRADMMHPIPPRRLKSDLLLVKPTDAERYVELRDVFEVDGNPVRDRQSRLEALLRDPSALANRGIQSIITESAKYNVGRITRTINTPLMALLFLDAANQPRFKFKHVDAVKPVFKDAPDAAANDAPVFRVSTEMWTIEFEERRRNTIIRNLGGRDVPAHGRFWINPSNGAVLMSEIIVDRVGNGVIATVTVSYQSEPLVGFLVPIEMRESYVRYGERISGRAEYGKFRQIR